MGRTHRTSVNTTATEKVVSKNTRPKRMNAKQGEMRDNEPTTTTTITPREVMLRLAQSFESAGKMAVSAGNNTNLHARAAVIASIYSAHIALCELVGDDVATSDYFGNRIDELFKLAYDGNFEVLEIISQGILVDPKGAIVQNLFDNTLKMFEAHQQTNQTDKENDMKKEQETNTENTEAQGTEVPTGKESKLAKIATTTGYVLAGLAVIGAIGYGLYRTRASSDTDVVYIGDQEV